MSRTYRRSSPTLKRRFEGAGEKNSSNIFSHISEYDEYRYDENGNLFVFAHNPTLSYKKRSKTGREWFSGDEFVELLNKFSYDRWGKYESRDKSINFRNTRFIKELIRDHSRANKRRQCYMLKNDPESDYLLVTAFEKGIAWIVD